MKHLFLPAARVALFGQSVLYLLIAAQILMRPKGLTANDGLSYFDTFSNTAPLYTLALAVNGFCSVRSAWLLPKQSTLCRWIAIGLWLIAACLLGLIFTPYSLGFPFNRIHVGFGSALFTVQMTIAIALAFRVRDRFTGWLAGIQAVAGVGCLLSLMHVTGCQIEGQVVFQLCFGLILLRYLFYEAALE